MKRYAPLGFLAAGILLAFFPNLKEVLGYKAFLLTFLYFSLFWIAQATSWNLLTGYSGYFSFGHGAFYGVGVYTTARLMEATDIPYLLTLPLAGILASILGLIVGLVVFRMRQLQGELFGLLTLAVAFVVASIVENADFIDGGQGISIGRFPYPEFLGNFSEMIFRVGIVVTLITIFTAYWIYHSRLGRGLFAIRDDEAVAEGLGVPTFKYKMIAFGISTFFAGVAGGMHSIQIGFVTAGSVFGLRLPLFVILMSLLGGRRHWLGPAIGAIVIHTLNDAFSSTREIVINLPGEAVFAVSGSFVNEVIIGGLLIAIILFLPDGIYERLIRRIVPSLALATLVGVVQAVTIGGRITEQLAVIMLFVIALLMIPEGFYQRYIGRFVPARGTALTTIDEATTGE